MVVFRCGAAACIPHAKYRHLVRDAPHPPNLQSHAPKCLACIFHCHDDSEPSFYVISDDFSGQIHILVQLSQSMAYVHNLVKQAVRRGEIVRSITCEACGLIRATFAHHDDYVKPLDVRWLCKACHAAWHSANGPGQNAELADLTMRRYSEKDTRRPAMIDLLRAGQTLEQIGETFGISRERVRQIAGSPYKYRLRRCDVIEAQIEAHIEEINQMRRAGRPLDEIAASIGVPAYFLRGIELEAKGEKPIQHGTLTGYRRGCACGPCRHANVLQTKKTIHSLRERGLCVVCCQPSGGRQKCRACYERWYLKHYKRQPGAVRGRPVGASGVRGIVAQSSGRGWRVYRYVNGKQVHYGCFKNLDDAKAFNATLDQKGSVAA